MLALAVVGLLILISGMIELERGKSLDFVGLGLVGMSGLKMYGVFLFSLFTSKLLTPT